MNQHKQRVLAVFWENAARIFPKEFGLDSCIGCCRVAFDVLRHFRIRVTPIATKMTVYNPLMTERIIAGQRCESPEQIAEWRAAGCIMLVVDRVTRNEGRWPGHLVVVIEDEVIMDATLPQATRPEWAIELLAFYGRVQPGFVQGTANHVEIINGCGVKYEPFLDDKTFQGTPFWSKLDRTKEVTNLIKSRIRAELRGR